MYFLCRYSGHVLLVRGGVCLSSETRSQICQQNRLDKSERLVRRRHKLILLDDLSIQMIDVLISLCQGMMNTNKEDMRELAAQLYAVVVSTMSGNELKIAVQNLIKITKDTHVCTFTLFGIILL